MFKLSSRLSKWEHGKILGVLNPKLLKLVNVLAVGWASGAWAPPPFHLWEHPQEFCLIQKKTCVVIKTMVVLYVKCEEIEFSFHGSTARQFPGSPWMNALWRQLALWLCFALPVLWQAAFPCSVRRGLGHVYPSLKMAFFISKRLAKPLLAKATWPSAPSFVCFLSLGWEVHRPWGGIPWSMLGNRSPADLWALLVLNTQIFGSVLVRAALASILGRCSA